MTYIGWERRHRVTTIRPGKLDLFVFTFIDGKRANIDAIMEYDAAMTRAEALFRHHPCQIKVLPLTGEEARNMLGVSLPDHPEPIDPALREQMVATLTKIARDSSDMDAHRDALDLLAQIGAQS